jgi:predicted PurR-regulated permease PerM
MNSYTLFLTTPNKPLFPFFTFTIEETRGILTEAFCWSRHQLTSLTNSNLCDSFIKWCESMTDEVHHVVCVPTSVVVSLANKYVTWTSSIKMLSEQIRLLTKEIPQISKIHSFLFLMDFLPSLRVNEYQQIQDRKRKRNNENENIQLNKKFKDLLL